MYMYACKVMKEMSRIELKEMERSNFLRNEGRRMYVGVRDMHK